MAQLSSWVNCYAARGGSDAGRATIDLQPLNGDAGFRRYFRPQPPCGLLAVHAPPDREKVAEFVSIDLLLLRHGVAVPAIYAVDFQRGFLLIEDFGAQQMLNALNAESVSRLYQAALNEMLRMQRIGPSELADIAPYNAQLLCDEMVLFADWFVGKLLGKLLTEAEQALLNEVFDLLIQSAVAQPQAFVHRDFHSRNLMLADDGRLGVIDFQDGVVGPVTYDAVSLLRDCYVRWPQQEVAAWFADLRETAIGEGVWPDYPLARYQQWFDWMGLQRHIKVLGIFARLYLRDGKPGYLNDLPLVLRYVLEVSEGYRELTPFRDWLVGVILPLAKQQPWYRDWQVAGAAP